jgi:chromosome segregation ATPase
MEHAGKVTAAYQAEIEVRLELSKANRRVTTAEQALGLAKGELVRLEKGNETTARVFSSVQDERDLLKARLANSYERLGKRFQKIGKV